MELLQFNSKRPKTKPKQNPNSPIRKIGIGYEWTFLQRRHANGQQVYEKLLNITSYHVNANQKSQENANEKQKIASVGGDVEELELWHTVGGSEKWCKHY